MKYLPASTKKKLLPWKLLYSGSPQTQAQSRLPFSSGQAANHCVRHSRDAAPEPPPLVNEYHSFHHPPSYSECQDTSTSLAISLQTEQWRKRPQLNQAQSTPLQFHAPFRSSMIWSLTILLLMAAQTNSTNIARLQLTYSSKL